VNSLTHEGESACYLAAQRGHLAAVRLLLRAHADIDQLTNDSSCPLYAGTTLPVCSERTFKCQPDATGLIPSALPQRWAAGTGRSWSCWWAKVPRWTGHTPPPAGPAFTRRCTRSARNATTSARRREGDPHAAGLFQGHKEIVRILVGVCNLEAVDDHEISPLFVAAQYGRRECLEILVNAGESV